MPKQQIKKAPLDDLEFYPPFEGFPREGMKFLKSLKRNNNRPWFEKHKSEYESYVKLPMQSLIVALQPHMAKFAPEFELHPKRSLFRIYRDVRFSKDKSPYKTHAAIQSLVRGAPKGVEAPGYYLHFEPGQVFIGSGVYMPSSDSLKKIRRAMVERSKEFLSLVEGKAFVKRFGTIGGEKLQRVPQGYPPDHPMADWLKHKQFFVFEEWAESKCYSEKFLVEAAKSFEAASPLVRWLKDAMK